MGWEPRLPLSGHPCSSSAPITSCCSRGRKSPVVLCSSCATIRRAGFTGCMTPIPDHQARPIVLRLRKGQQRRQTLSRDRIRQAGQQNTRALLRLLILLTAREDGLWADRRRQGTNSATGRHSGGQRGRVPGYRSRHPWHPVNPPKVAPFYPAAITTQSSRRIFCLGRPVSPLQCPVPEPARQRPLKQFADNLFLAQPIVPESAHFVQPVNLTAS
jgi:hypothetical protein